MKNVFLNFFVGKNCLPQCELKSQQLLEVYGETLTHDMHARTLAS